MALFGDLNPFDPHVDEPLFVNANAIAQAIYNLLSTRRGERLFNPRLGSDLEDLLFEPILPDTEIALLSTVSESVNNFEPRARLSSAQTRITAIPTEYKYDVELVFVLTALNNQIFRYSGAFTQNETD